MGGNAIPALLGIGNADGPKGNPAGSPTPIKDKPVKDLALDKKSPDAGPPTFLGLSAGMTPLQQRTAIATGATQGNSMYTDPEALRYYQQLALGSLLGREGATSDYSDITDVEKQYIKSLGQSPLQGTTESYLSALSRAVDSLGSGAST